MGDFNQEIAESEVYPPPEHFQKNAHVKSREEFDAMYKASIEEPDKFWGDMARNLHWETPFSSVGPEYNFDRTKGDVSIKWFQGGKTNLCYNCLDVHIKAGHGARTAIYFEGNGGEDLHKAFTYQETFEMVCKLANALKAEGVQKGDRVTVYLPMTVQLPATMLACARLGIIHSVVFGGFSADALAGRIVDAQSKVLFEGVPNFPDVDRFWAICEKYKVTTFYTAPTAIRSLMKFGEEPVKKRDLSALRILGTVGEPINPAAWRWYYQVVGSSRCPIADTYWQTETAAHLITPLCGAVDTKPGSASLPFFGVLPAIVDEKGNELEGVCQGSLVLKKPTPSMMRTVFGDHKRFEETYFSQFNGSYFTGDGCKRDKDGFLWLTGRMDDVINVSGHRIGTAEVESALVAFPKVAEAAVVGFPHDVKGEGIWCYVTLKEGEAYDDALKPQLKTKVREVIGAFAMPDEIHWAPGLPKTRSGKIMRRVLRKLALPDYESQDLGDTSTLADPSVVDTLKEKHPRKKAPAA